MEMPVTVTARSDRGGCATPAIGLELFCSADRDELSEPFSVGTHTYASNGHICIRVPRRADVQELKATSEASKRILDGVSKFFRDGVHYRALAPFDLPPEEDEPCGFCNGRGTEHACPDCTCECANCNDGKVSSDERLSVGINGAPFAAHYVRMLLALPGLQVNEANWKKRGQRGCVLQFRFDGGDGVLMGVEGRGHTHIESGSSDSA